MGSIPEEALDAEDLRTTIHYSLLNICRKNIYIRIIAHIYITQRKFYTLNLGNSSVFWL